MTILNVPVPDIRTVIQNFFYIRQTVPELSGHIRIVDPDSMILWIRIQIELKCWIRIRIESIRIHNTGLFSTGPEWTACRIGKYRYLKKANFRLIFNHYMPYYFFRGDFLLA
jgi:hypothetical protein